MNEYHKILLLLEALLRQSGDTHWKQQIAKDIVDWETKGHTQCFKRHFGGMGSINDISVAPSRGVGNWSNNLFTILKDVGYTYAYKQAISYSQSYREVIDGAICRSCSYSEIGEPELENYLSLVFLPVFIKSMLPSENYMSLLNIERLSQTSEVKNLRSSLLTCIHNSGITYKPKIQLFDKGCQQCLQSDISAYRWIVIANDSVIRLERSRDNLRIKADGPRWWQKLFFGKR